MDRDDRPFPVGVAQPPLDVDGEPVRFGDRHRAVDADMHLDGDVLPDTPRAQVMRRRDGRIGRDQREDVFLLLAGSDFSSSSSIPIFISCHATRRISSATTIAAAGSASRQPPPRK